MTAKEYKRKSGYQLKKGASGEMRWHKRPESKQVTLKNPPKRLKTKDGRVIYQQPSFKITPADLNLDTHPDQFYDSRSRLVLPSFNLNGEPDYTAPDTAFHGTRYNFEEFGRTAIDRPKNTGHWNNVLGPHLAADNLTSDKFAEGTVAGMANLGVKSRIPNGKPGRVLETVLAIRRPLVIPSERDFNGLAMAHILLGPEMDDDAVFDRVQNGYGRHIARFIEDVRDPRNKDHPLIKIKMLKDFITGTMSPEGFYKYAVAPDLGTGSYGYDGEESEDGIAETHEEWYSAMMEGALDFKTYLESLGYDGIVYRNDIEGGIGIAPFDSDQIKIIGEYRGKKNTKIVRPSAKDLLDAGKKGNFRHEHVMYDDQLDMLHEDIIMADRYKDTAMKTIPTGEQVGSNFESINKARKIWGRMYAKRGVDSLWEQVSSRHVSQVDGVTDAEEIKDKVAQFK